MGDRFRSVQKRVRKCPGKGKRKVSEKWIWIRKKAHVLKPSMKSIYVIYVVAVSLFALAIAGFSLFGFVDIFLTKEAIALIIIGLVGPLVPFTKRIILPGGTEAFIDTDFRDHLRTEIPKTEKDTVISIGDFDLETSIMGSSEPGATGE